VITWRHHLQSPSQSRNLEIFQQTSSHTFSNCKLLLSWARNNTPFVRLSQFMSMVVQACWDDFWLTSCTWQQLWLHCDSSWLWNLCPQGCLWGSTHASPWVLYSTLKLNPTLFQVIRISDSQDISIQMNSGTRLVLWTILTITITGELEMVCNYEQIICKCSSTAAQNWTQSCSIWSCLCSVKQIKSAFYSLPKVIQSFMCSLSTQVHYSHHDSVLISTFRAEEQFAWGFTDI
jgi:hypothetical protein